MCCVVSVFSFCFFFKQKTAYEMRISDWSSDVCSSDLVDVAARRLSDPLAKRRAAFLRAQLRAAETRLMIMQGTRFAFDDHAERLFGVRPALKPPANYDPVLPKLENLVPGEGALWARAAASLEGFTTPKRSDAHLVGKRMITQ